MTKMMMKTTMKINALFVAIAIALLASCGTAKHTPKQETIYRYVDSTVFHDSTILVEIPVEKVVDVVRDYDTLRMETSVAKAQAYVDTNTHTLKGSLENKDVPLKETIKWKEHIVYKDSIQTQVVEKEVKVPIETVPWHYWLWFSIAFLSIIILVIKVVLKLK